ncbi:hypothetical protein X773_24805 [Mesorhizobium sp. LSJC285A00]|nr:hypothetical protein X773_24805 [Mesorhizobium sp. LSJC285A00]ESX22525.1 hypothetical protein X765_30550 [Mesorhizobium sp. LSHC440B00]ESX66609.1 hypothetical protein X757_31115 [Mesorhizobium sp. LSHC414A00]ESY18696.1 hypothetical protein X751_16300 [Mesorhizobium sp. LNJC395A00]ESZ28334.1 hypothetical protein X732_32075 [Mesorhizobium sp. L2C066B000]
MQFGMRQLQQANRLNELRRCDDGLLLALKQAC